MDKTITISTTTFSRLEKLVEGFDTPDAVIVRLLNTIDGKGDEKPILTFNPSDEDLFKHKLIQGMEAEVVISKADGTREINRWRAKRFSKTSNLRGNLWSGVLRGWKGKGIINVDLSILPRGDASLEDEVERDKALALALDLTFDEIQELTYDVDDNSSDEGLVYGYIVEFSEDCDPEILAKITGLDEYRCVRVESSCFADAYED